MRFYHSAPFFILAFVASFLRFFRIYDLTEFLADQGRTGIVIFEAFSTHTLPLVGPPVLTGQHLGPIFYYLVSPAFLLANFHPLGPAFFMAGLGVLSVLIVYYLGRKLFGFWIGFFVAALFCVSSTLITQTRTLWDPTPIPFFVTLFILSIYKVYEEKNFRWLLVTGVVTGILIQLHYPNIFFVPLGLLFVLYLARSEGKKGSIGKIIRWSFRGLLGFLITIFPFLLYEMQHSFADLREVVLIFLTRSGSDVVATPYYEKVFDVSVRLFQSVLPVNQPWIQAVLITVSICLPFLRKNFWHVLFASWFVVGVLAISLYKGTIFDHYLSFLLPIPFFLIGSLVKVISVRIPKKILVGVAVLFVIANLTHVDIFAKANNDIEKTSRMTEAVINQANGKLFSFTIISSRSFSDLHYRYFFRLHDVKPEKITDTNYDLLFLVCEKAPCPKVLENETVQVMCYDPHCEVEYPKIALSGFRLASTKDVLDGRIFTYERSNDTQKPHNQ